MNRMCDTHDFHTLLIHCLLDSRCIPLDDAMTYQQTTFLRFTIVENQVPKQVVISFKLYNFTVTDYIMGQ